SRIREVTGAEAAAVGSPPGKANIKPARHGVGAGRDVDIIVLNGTRSGHTAPHLKGRNADGGVLRGGGDTGGPVAAVVPARVAGCCAGGREPADDAGIVEGTSARP